MSSLSEKFTFINVSGPNQGKDENLRKVVRSNAMIKYRQKEKQKAIKQHRRETVQKTVAEDSLATPPASEPWGPMGPSDNWPHNTCNDWPPEWKKALSETQTMVQPSVQPLEDRRARKSVTFTALSVSMFEKSLVSSPRSIFGGGVDEPFDAYPIGGFSRYNSYVLHHCKLPALSQSVYQARFFNH